MADLSIPRIQLSAAVLHGSDAQTLRRGPGHLENSAPPGERGNSVIAGHRDSFFWPLRNVRLGDDIFVGMPQGRVHYRVTSLRVVDPKDVSVLESTGDAILTLITCYPFSVLGPAPFRFVVQAARVDVPTAQAFTIATTAPRQPVREPDPGRQVPVTPHVVPDNDALVREAIERFRLTYNARLFSHEEARPGGALTFETCAIDIASHQAAATCVSSQSPDDGASHMWTMTLERTDAGWAIRSIETT